MAAIRTMLKKILFSIYLLVCAEIIFRIIATVTIVPDVELLSYATTMVRKTNRHEMKFEHLPGARKIIMGHEIALNDQGHRGESLFESKRSSEKRIYFMGNSITLGWGVSQEETFAEIAAQELNVSKSKKRTTNVVAVNAGVANYNTIQMAALFNKDLDVIKPDAVVLQYFIRDVEPKAEGDNAILKYSYFAAFLYRHILNLWLSSGRATDGDPYSVLYQVGQKDWEATKMVIRRLARVLNERRTPFFIVIIPDLRDPTLDGRFSIHYDKIEKFLESVEVKVIDPRREIALYLRDRPKTGWVHPADPHPNPEIHSIIGKTVARYLSKLPSW